MAVAIIIGLRIQTSLFEHIEELPPSIERELADSWQIISHES
jgi:hypothetical protein